jgi:hypothetical protein
VTCLTEGNDRIQDTVAPFLVTTIGLYGYEANNGIRGYVATGEWALEGESSSVSLWKQKNSDHEEILRSEKSAISKSCSN